MMKLTNKVNNDLKEVSQDAQIEVAMGKVVSQLASLARKSKDEEKAVYNHLKSYLTIDKKEVIQQIKKEL